MDLPDSFLEQVCEAGGSAFVDLIKSVAYRCKEAILRLPYRYHFAKCSNEFARLVPFPLSYVWCTNYYIYMKLLVAIIQL